MERKNVQPSTSKGEPPLKKRKTESCAEEEDNAELWDDEEFTEADLDDIADQEIRASQAISSRQTAAHSFSNVTFEERETTDTFLKPHLSRSSSSIGSHSNSTSSRRSSSVLSSNSFPRLQNSDSSYPASLSEYSGTSSSSVKSGEQVSVLRKPAYASNGSSSDSDNVSAVDEITRMKRECDQLKQKVSTLNDDLCAKDGENKLLRDNLVKKEGELDSLKTEKINLINTQNKQQSEKEKNLQTEVTWLKTQLQFKEQDERELSSRVKELEGQISALQTGPSSSQAVPQEQSSPRPPKVQVKDISPEKPSKSGFPTKRTFMAFEGSPRKQVKTTHSAPTTSKIHVQSRTANIARVENKLRLNTKVTQRTRECQLVARLLDISPGVTGQNNTKSIVGLLNTPWISSCLQNIQFDRDKDTSLLSPVKSRLSDVNMLLSQTGKESDLVRLVHPDHFNLAMKGLKLLLNESKTNLSQMGTSSHMNLFDLDLSQKSDNSESNSGSHWHRISFALGQSTIDSAILLLPMIQDYLQHYIDMLETSVETPQSASGISTGTSSSSESFDSSSESPTGSLGLLLRSSTTYANNLESLAIAALKTLCTLVDYECVRKVLYYTDEDNLTPTSETGTTGPPAYTHIPLKLVLKQRLLRKVFRLTKPHGKGHLSNKEVVETSLSILEILAKHAQESDVNSLLPVMTEDVIQYCVENEEEPTIVLQGLLLFKALCKNKLVVSSLCSNPTGCVLLSVYSIGIGKKSYLDRQDKVTLSIIKMVIESIFYIACSHKGGIYLLMDSDCQCSVEVVKCIVLLLYKVLRIYEHFKKDNRLTSSPILQTESQSELIQGTCLDILENGLLLLHLMSQHDQEFMSRHAPVQNNYVLLICGMSQIVKYLPSEKSECALTALQELWDFNQDDSELSPDSDTDMTDDRDGSL